MSKWGFTWNSQSECIVIPSNATYHWISVTSYVILKQAEAFWKDKDKAKPKTSPGKHSSECVQNISILRSAEQSRNNGREKKKGAKPDVTFFLKYYFIFTLLSVFQLCSCNC